MGSARGHSVFLISAPFRKLFNVRLNHDGTIGFDIGSDFSHCPPPGTMRDYLNPPLIRADGSPSANLSSEITQKTLQIHLYSL
jgi:hypothetical protein